MSKKTSAPQNPKLPSWGVRMQDFKGENLNSNINRIQDIWKLLIGKDTEVTIHGFYISTKELFDPKFLLPFVLYFCKTQASNSVSFAVKQEKNCLLGVETVDIEITNIQALTQALKRIPYKSEGSQLDLVLDEMALWLSRDGLDGEAESIEDFSVNVALESGYSNDRLALESGYLIDRLDESILEDEEYYTNRVEGEAVEGDGALVLDQVDQAFAQAMRELIVKMSGNALGSPGSLMFLDGLKDFPDIFMPDPQNSDWTQAEKENYTTKVVDINLLKKVTKTKFINDIREMLCKGMIVLVRGLPPDPDGFTDIPSIVIKISDIMPQLKRAIELLRDQGFKFEFITSEKVKLEDWLDNNRFFHLDPNQADSIRHWLRLQIKAGDNSLTNTSLVHLKTIFNLQKPMRVSIEDAKIISDMSETNLIDMFESFIDIENFHSSFHNANDQSIDCQQLAGIAIIGNQATEEQGNWNYTLDSEKFTNVSRSVSEASALVLSPGVVLNFLAADGYKGQIPALKYKIIPAGDYFIGGITSANTLLDNKQAISCVDVTGLKAVESSIHTKASSVDESIALEMGKDSSIDTNPQGKTLKSVKVLDNLGETERGDARRYQSLLQPMPLQGKNDPDWIWKSMQAEFPWMQEANQALAEAAGICNAAGTDYFRLSKAILMVGKPGIGKTRWARRAAQLLELKSGSLSLGGVSTSMSLIGSERGWANGNPSFPARIMHRYNVANPLLFIDEIDKVGESKQNGNPVDAILSMLERESASCFPDNYLQGNLNLKYCSWIFAVNSIASLGQPLLSRVRVVQIASPRAEHFPILFKGIIEDFCSENELAAEKLPDMSDQQSRFERAFLENLSARMLQSTIEDWLRAQFWQPPGPRLVVENKK